MIIPDGVRSIIIIADNDSEAFALNAHIRTAINRFLSRAIAVSVHWPPPGLDFNKLLLPEMEEAR